MLGDALITIDGAVELVTGLELIAEPTIVYNLSLFENYTFFADGILVHNMSAGFYAMNGIMTGELIKDGEMSDTMSDLSTQFGELSGMQSY